MVKPGWKTSEETLLNIGIMWCVRKSGFQENYTLISHRRQFIVTSGI